MEPKPITPSPNVETIEQVVEFPLEDLEEKGIVIVHCRFNGEGAIRIWRSTFLIDRNSNHRSKMLHADNIAMAPQWLPVLNHSGHTFTLYFEALPKSCVLFDLHEIIPQPGGFLIKDISRNEVDVYHIEII